MTRFLMDLNEAVNLVCYAFNNANSGDIYVQKSPSSNIDNLSKAILEIFDISKKNRTIIGTEMEKNFMKYLLVEKKWFMQLIKEIIS